MSPVDGAIALLLNITVHFDNNALKALHLKRQLFHENHSCRKSLRWFYIFAEILLWAWLIVWTKSQFAAIYFDHSVLNLSLQVPQLHANCKFQTTSRNNICFFCFCFLCLSLLQGWKTYLLYIFRMLNFIHRMWGESGPLYFPTNIHSFIYCPYHYNHVEVIGRLEPTHHELDESGKDRQTNTLTFTAVVNLVSILQPTWAACIRTAEGE